MLLQPDSKPRSPHGLYVRRGSKRTLGIALAVAAAVVAIETTTHLLDFGIYDLRIKLLDSAYEWSYSHLVATSAFAAGTVCGFLGARAAQSLRGAWWVTCYLFGFLLVDNVTRLHEHLGPWPVLYAPILVGLFIALAALARGSDLAVVVYAGIALLFVSLGIHVFGPGIVRIVGWSPSGWGYQVKVALKEGTELAGWVLLVPALAQLAQRARMRQSSAV